MDAKTKNSSACLSEMQILWMERKKGAEIMHLETYQDMMEQQEEFERMEGIDAGRRMLISAIGVVVIALFSVSVIMYGVVKLIF